MTTSEFSNSFDAIIDSYKRFKDFDKQELLDSVEFNEYEKSLFLTTAQESIVIDLYTGRNSIDSFESTEEYRRYLANLAEEINLEPITTENGKPLGMGNTSKFFTLPSNLMFITYENVTVASAVCDTPTVMDVMPVRQDEYNRLKKNPFRGANDRRALRLDLSNNNIEIVCKYDITNYYVRYIRRPNPIILETLQGDLSVEGKQDISECELTKELHNKILTQAVNLALMSKGISVSRSEDNKEN